MDDKLSIRINIADRYYPLKIERGDEEKIRKAAKLINEKVLQYKQKYIDKDIQDFLAMAALQYVIKALETEQQIETDNLKEDLNDLNKELDQILKEE
ncbi:MAG: cell division protein ZapA [Bacteroidales bacterium]|nr:cell division protein ZapA [Bacteroidales bacterium]